MLVEDCTVANIPVEYTGATGLFAGYVSGLTVQHNLFANQSYSAMTIGWGWGRTGSGRGNNTIRANRIERPTTVRCCDGGGIYTLGPQPGSTVSRNHILQPFRDDWPYPRQPCVTNKSKHTPTNPPGGLGNYSGCGGKGIYHGEPRLMGPLFACSFGCGLVVASWLSFWPLVPKACLLSVLWRAQTTGAAVGTTQRTSSTDHGTVSSPSTHPGTVSTKIVAGDLGCRHFPGSIILRAGPLAFGPGENSGDKPAPKVKARDLCPGPDGRTDHDCRTPHKSRWNLCCICQKLQR